MTIVSSINRAVFALVLAIFCSFSVYAEHLTEAVASKKESTQQELAKQAVEASGIDYFDYAEAPGITWGLIKFLRKHNSKIRNKFDPVLQTRHRRTIVILNDYIAALGETREGAAKLVAEFGILEGRTQKNEDGNLELVSQEFEDFQKKLAEYLEAKILIGNFHHNHKKRYFIAEIDRGSVEKAELVVEFHPGRVVNGEEIRVEAHSEVRFVLSKGQYVTLIATTPSNKEMASGVLAKPRAVRDRIELGELIYSVEAIGTGGELPGGYSQVKGQFGLFGLVHRVTSMSEKARVMYEKERIGKRKWLNSYDKKESNIAFEYFLQKAHESGMSETYNTFWRSCTETIVQYFEEALPYTRDITLKSWGSWRGVKRNMELIKIAVLEKIAFHTQLLPSKIDYGLRLRRMVKGPREIWDLGHVKNTPEARPVYEKVQKRLARKRAAKCAASVGENGV